MSDRPLELAQAHLRAGRLADAQALYRLAHAADPDDAAILHMLGIVTCQLGEFPEGVALLSRAAALAPDVPDYQLNLGSALAKSEQPERAIAAYRKALDLNPNYPEAYANLSAALCDTGKYEDAVAAARRALALRPDYPSAHNNLGRSLRALGFLDDSIACFRRASELQQNSPEIASNLADALLTRGQFQPAVAAARQAVDLNPHNVRVAIQLGQALALSGDVDESLSLMQKVTRANPSNADAQNALAAAQQAAGDIGAAISSFSRAVDLDPSNAAIHSNLVYALHFDPDSDPKTILQKHLEWNDLHAAPLRGLRRWLDTDRAPDRRLRIGYVSPDFNKHVVGRNVLPLVRHREATQFEVFCYSNTIRPDSMTEQFQAFADGWRDIVGVPDTQVAESIRRDRIDILIDFSLHMRGNRILLFAYKPAPVQATFAGYPSTTGLETIDYRITDPHVDPEGESDSYYREKSLRLPNSFWCYDMDAMELAGTQASPERFAGPLTFGCLNNFVKTNDRTFQLWSKILAAVPDSRFILMSPKGEHRRRVAEKLGIDLTRIDFVEPQPREHYLQIYRRIDIGLDTFPYNGHTTNLDALWMSVPVVSIRGQSAISRAAYSQSQNLGLADELVGDTPEDFILKAVSLANDPKKLAELRAGLPERMRSSPLMNAVQFARDFEQILRQMWRLFLTR
jgi:protein O-GlcNAc transferase